MTGTSVKTRGAGTLQPYSEKKMGTLVLLKSETRTSYPEVWKEEFPHQE
jgi:hypothetical protein